MTTNTPGGGKDESRYEPTSNDLVRKVREQVVTISRLEDFIEYLFDHSEHCDHITQSEAWAEFEEWEQKQENEQP